MTAPQNAIDVEEVLIYEPDHRLKEKLGKWVTFAQTITPQIMEEAEKVVTEARGKLLDENMASVATLENLLQEIKAGAPAHGTVERMDEAAFAIKSLAGFCGYSLAAALARSLKLFCELLGMRDGDLNQTEKEIIACHVNGIKTVFSQKITGDGGTVGKAITFELESLAKNYENVSHSP